MLLYCDPPMEISCKKFRYLMIPNLCDTNNLSVAQFHQIVGLVIWHYVITEKSSS